MIKKITFLRLCTLTATLIGATAAHAQNAGSLDTTFGVGGKFVAAYYYDQQTEDIAMQADGKIIAVGWTKASSGSDYNFFICRFTANGTMDTTFGPNGNGTISIDIKGTNKFDVGRCVAVQPDGKIIVAGTAGLQTDNSASHAGFIRLNSDGTLDNSFGTAGKFSFPVGNDTSNPYVFINEVQIQPDGKIVGIGRARNSSTAYDYAIVRLNADGTLDSDFSNDGKHTVDFGGPADEATHLKILPDGKMLVAGNTSEDLGIVRLFDDGSVDNSYGTLGKLEIVPGEGSYYLRGIAWQADGKIVTSGHTIGASNIQLNRWNADGTADTSFGTDGVTETDVDSGSDDQASKALLIQDDGKIIVLGRITTGSTSYFGVLRYTDAGILDSTFSNDGQVLTTFGTAFSFATSGMLQPDGKLLVAGLYGYSFNWGAAIARYHTTALLGIEESQRNDMVVYPNPASEVLMITGNGLESQKFEIIDIAGKSVMQGVFSADVTQQIQISGLPQGMYYLTVKNSGNAMPFVKK